LRRLDSNPFANLDHRRTGTIAGGRDPCFEILPAAQTGSLHDPNSHGRALLQGVIGMSDDPFTLV